jgi:multidrug efflux pump subunit AcrB
VLLAQVTDAVQTEWEDPLIWRRDRRRTITVQANPILGATLKDLRNTVAEQIEQLELPPGYTLKWGGELESSTDSQ